MKILLVEDDTALAMGAQYSLQKEGFEVICASNLNESRHFIHSDKFDMILLDVTLPDGNGFEFCREIRESGNDISIIFLTAVDEEANVVLGLDMGADDYLTKPIRVRELIARINAVSRRKGKLTSDKEDKKNDEIIYKDIKIYPLRYEVYKGDKKISLTSSEYKLMLILIKNKGNVLTRKQILEKLWDVEGDFIDEKTLTVYIKRLREKLGIDNKYIETVRGIGYKWIGDNE